MKKKCKDIDITNVETIKPWVYDCIHRHYHRHDFRRFLLEHGLSKEAYDTGNAFKRAESLISEREKHDRGRNDRITSCDGRELGGNCKAAAEGTEGGKV